MTPTRQLPPPPTAGAPSQEMGHTLDSFLPAQGPRSGASEAPGLCQAPRVQRLFCCRTCKRKAGDAEALAVSATYSRGHRTSPWVGTRAFRLSFPPVGAVGSAPPLHPCTVSSPPPLPSQPSFPSCNPGAGQDRAGARPPQEGKCFQAMNVRVPFGGEAGRLPEPQVTSWTHKLSPSISTSSPPPMHTEWPAICRN